MRQKVTQIEINADLQTGERVVFVYRNDSDGNSSDWPHNMAYTNVTNASLRRLARTLESERITWWNNV